MRIVWAWPLKRSAFARLARVASGELPTPDGADALVSTPDRQVEVSAFLPAEPARICVYGTPLSMSRTEQSGESRPSPVGPGGVAVVEVERIRLEVRVRVYDPGEDVDGVDRTLGDVCSAVASTLLSAPLFSMGRLYLSGMTQDPTAMAANPEPSVIGNAVLVFSAEVVTI